MCSVGDDIDEIGENKFMTRQRKVDLLESKCNKCREEIPCVVLRGKDAYCRRCFLSGTIHKFKSLLGKHHLIRPQDCVLVLHETGYASGALLHFLRSGLDLDTPKKLRLNPIFLFVDKFASLTVKEREKLRKDVHNQLKIYNFPIYFTSLYSYINHRGNIEKLLVTNPEDCLIYGNDLEIVNSKIDPKASATKRNEILEIFKQELLVEAAKQLSCKFVFTPELSVDTASRMLSNISLGRGVQLPVDVGFCDYRDPEVKILRPLRVFEIKELVFYNVYNNVMTVHGPIDYSDNPYDSVHSLMKKFVVDLQINYPATIATILRTGDKLSLDQNIQINEKCKLCKAPVENETEGLTSNMATEVSRWMSTQEKNDNDSFNESHNTFVHRSDNTVNSRYCYSCTKLACYIKL